MGFGPGNEFGFGGGGEWLNDCVVAGADDGGDLETTAVVCGGGMVVQEGCAWDKWCWDQC